MPEDDHGDARSIVTLDLQAQADQCGCPDVATVVANIVHTLGAHTHDPMSKEKRDIVPGAVLKADDAKRYLLTVAYPAYKDAAVGADGFRDAASEEVVERAAWNFMRKGARVGMWHKRGFDKAAQVVENYIWRGEPWAIKAADGTEQVVMPGDWLVGMVLSEPTWALYKAQVIGGVSVQGGAKRRVPTPDTLERVRSRSHG